MNAGGVIQRVVTIPEFRTEYLKTDAVVAVHGRVIFSLADIPDKTFPHGRAPSLQGAEHARIEPKNVRELSFELRTAPEWSERRFDALFFALHSEADARAVVLRAATGDTIFAAVAKAAEHRTRGEPETAGFVPVRPLPAKKKKKRADRDREEMQANDVAELNEVAING